ncbi:hypothetical protein CASFOL_021484 [Castilleja foliolosa]|uniref:Bet v I/Major latex protein domain-containing protein n=1 Tax=Castilleja foliolosa TaxID=1961234 RepID=A0ABD3CWQ3_9LAMI
MGVKKFFQELKTKVSPSRLFKALVTESHDVIPKLTPAVKSIETIEGDGVGVGCLRKTTFPESSQIKYVTHRVDAIDHDNYTCKYTLVDGDVIGDKLEKVCYEIKFEATEDGGCVIKLESEYHTKGDFELKDEEVEAGKEQALGLYKACEDYLVAHPDVCA